MNEESWTKLALAAGLVLLLIFAQSCNSETEPERVETQSSRFLKYIPLDGMVCVVYDGGKRFGITCDFDSWNGKIEDGNITLPLQERYIPEPTEVARPNQEVCVEGEWDVMESVYATCATPVWSSNATQD